MTETSNNMKIWDSVSQTDPDHTKEVSFGRKFTAIDAHYQVMMATEQFGPVGQGWGYNTSYETKELASGDAVIFCLLTFWWRAEGEWKNEPKSYGPICGCARLQAKGKAVDTDAPKKAMTDALTKGLSHLGFSADVFLGMFDDNKYVEGRRKEKEQEKSAADLEYEQTRAGFIEKIEASTKKSQIEAIMKDYEQWIARLPKGKGVAITAWAEQKKGELSAS